MSEKMEKKKLPKIEAGFQLGHLKVISDTGNRKNGYIIWNCLCDCGASIELDTRTLQRGTVRDCGCITKIKPGQKDLTGMRFGRLIAFEPTQERGKSGGIIWRCRCDCGNECYAVSTQLTKGYRKSCDCWRHPRRKDFIGKTFGQLTVIDYAGKRSGMHRWKCLCTCGRETIVGQTLLQTGKTKSCGCLQASIITENMRFIEGTSVTLLETVDKRRLSTNSSGYTGVYLNRRKQKWIAQIGFKGKNYYLGMYEKIEEAVEARKKAEDRIYGEFLDWYYETYPDKKKIHSVK